MLKLAIISDFETSGGAAIATSRLAQALLQEDVDVSRIVAQNDSYGHPWKTHVVKITLKQKLILKIIDLFSVNLKKRLKTKILNNHFSRILFDINPDIINVHNLHGADWPPLILKTFIWHAPTIWTLHDMWSFTGGCTYSYDCRKFITGCDSFCPTCKEYPFRLPDYVSDYWRIRYRLLRKIKHLVAVSPSKWLAKQAKNGLWMDHRVEVIPNGLPLDVYKPIDRNIARIALGVETDGAVALTSAYDLNERRKGGDILLQALQQNRHRPLTVITMGHCNFPKEIDGIPILSLGFIDHERTKVLAYNSADFFIHPAPVDNLPNTVMESIACGVPVVAFNIGGISEMVRPRETGWLAQELSPKGLAKAIDSALFDIKQGINMRKPCNILTKNEYSLEVQAKKYLALYNSIVQIDRDQSSIRI